MITLYREVGTSLPETPALMDSYKQGLFLVFAGQSRKRNEMEGGTKLLVAHQHVLLCPSLTRKSWRHSSLTTCVLLYVCLTMELAESRKATVPRRAVTGGEEVTVVRGTLQGAEAGDGALRARCILCRKVLSIF